MIRGHHIYKRIGFIPTILKILLVNLDPANGHDRFAMAVLKAGAVVGHVP